MVCNDIKYFVGQSVKLGDKWFYCFGEVGVIFECFDGWKCYC